MLSVLVRDSPTEFAGCAQLTELDLVHPDEPPHLTTEVPDGCTRMHFDRAQRRLVHLVDGLVKK